MNCTFRHVRIDAMNCIIQLFLIERILIISFNIRTIHMLPSHILEKLYDRIFIVCFGVNA